MTVTQISGHGIKTYLGLSSDTKPTGVPPGSWFYATDTGTTYITQNGTDWIAGNPYSVMATGRTATYIIAASDSSSVEKAQADVVCTGASILTATVSASGGKIVAPTSIAAGSTLTTFTVNGACNITVTLTAGSTAEMYGQEVLSVPIQLVTGVNVVAVSGAGTFYISGGGDESVIYNAIQASSAHSRNIVLLEGTYTFFSDLIINYPISIVGSGKLGTEIKPAYDLGFDPTLTTNFIRINRLVYVNSNDVEIANLYFHCIYTVSNVITSPILTQTSNVSIHGCKVVATVLSGQPYPKYNVKSPAVAPKCDSTVDKCFNLYWAKTWKIYDNIVINQAYEAVSVGVNQPDGKYPIGCIIENNYFDGGYGGVAVEFGATDCIVANNYIRSRLGTRLGYGITFTVEGHNNVANGNTIDAQQYGVWFGEHSWNNKVTNNIIQATSPVGFINCAGGNEFSYNTCITRVLDEPPYGAIYTRAGDAVMTSPGWSIITNNTFTGFTRITDGYNDGYYAPMKLTNNIFRNCGQLVITTGEKGSIVKDNTFEACAQKDGYFLYNQHTNTDAEYVTRIENNKFTDLSASDSTTLNGAITASSSALTGNAAIGAYSIVVADATGLVADQIISIGDTTDTYEQNKIYSIVGTTINLCNALQQAYTTANTAKVWWPCTITVASGASYKFKIGERIIIDTAGNLENSEISGIDYQTDVIYLRGLSGAAANNSALVKNHANGVAVVGRLMTNYLFYETGGSDYNTYSGNNISALIANAFTSVSGAYNIIQDNIGYIGKGETRTISGALAGGALGAVTSIDNPFRQAVRVLSVDIEITTQSAASGTLCVGIGSSATTDYATMFSVLPTDVGTTYPYFFNSTKTATYGVQTNAINWATGSGNRYLNFYNHAATTSLVATYTITVMGN